IVLEVLVSTLLAPVRMLFHSKIVFVTLLGFETGWSRQQREDKPTGWGEALAFHLGGTVLASLWAAGLFLLNREFFWWVSPIFIPLILAVPLSVVTSLPGLGNWLRRRGLLLTPEETAPAPELVELDALEARNLAEDRPLDIPKGQGFALAVQDPATLALHLTALRGPRRVAPEIRAARLALASRVAETGPARLSAVEKRRLLMNGEALAALHRLVWRRPEAERRAVWPGRLG
ncbi:MAG: glucan biosynthesis glucosyltransferase H, partial [Desulfovibrionaceae bacterium]